MLGNHKVVQKDPLVPSEAILTVGLECSPAQQDIGVFWSLPLAHYRFYGPPKVATHSLCMDSERISLSQFSYVALGSFLSRWDFDGHQVSHHAKIIIRVYEYLTENQKQDGVNADTNRRDGSSGSTMQKFLRSNSNWLKHLAEACNGLENSSETDRAMYSRLIGVGLRRGSGFLSNQPPLFGLSSFDKFLDMLNGSEARIEALRRLAARFDLTGEDALIRYRNPTYNVDGSRKRRPSNSIPDPIHQWSRLCRLINPTYRLTI